MPPGVPIDSQQGLPPRRAALIGDVDHRDQP